MDFLEFAKWGIRVKEEPGTLGPLHRDKSIENNTGGLQRGWMCKFPCDAQGVLDSAVATTNEPYELLEPFERSPVNYVGEGHKYFNLQDSDKFTSCTTAEGNNNIQDHPDHIIQQDVPVKDYAVFRSTLEDNNIITSLSSSKESLKDDEKQMLDAVLNVQYDISEDLHPTADHIYQREIVQNLPKSTVSKRANEESFMVKNQNEILLPSDMELLFGAPENAVVELVKNSGRVEMSLNVENSISREIDSLTGEHVTAHQENSQKENNNDFRISEISSFECPDCGAVLKSFNSFITHMNSHIIEQRENFETIQCENCSEKFTDDKLLSLHRKECNGAKESNMPSSKKHNHNISNVVCVSVNCSEINSSVKQCASGDDSELTLSSLCQETSLKKCPEQPRYHEDLPSCSPKRRRQANTEESSTSEMPKSKNNWTIQNLGAADDAFDVSWSSEIKCRDEREGRSVGSVRTLSLRLFRFRKPRVVVKRAKVPVRSESVIKTLNASLGDSVSNNPINQKSVSQVENVENWKQLTNEPVTSGVTKISKSDSKVSCSSTVQPYRKTKHVHLEKGRHFARPPELTNAEKCHSHVNLTSGDRDPQNVESVFSDTPCSYPSKTSEKDKKSDEPVVNASSKFPSEDTKVRSNLKIKIKPVVVLDRLSTLNFNSNKSSQENMSKCVGGVSSSSQKYLPRGMNITIDSNAPDKCEIPSDETNSKKIAKTFVDQSARHFDSYHNANRQKGNGTSLADLEKRYGIKKCYVKLKRISVPFNLTKIVKNKREETECEMKTCGKLKFRRMSSKLWTVSSCTSALENSEVAECTEEGMKTVNCLCVPKDEQNRSDQEVHNKIYGQRSKKCIDSKGPPSLSESSEETLNYIRRGKHVKHFRSKCTCCQKIFFDEQDLAQHLETHLSGYKCPNCSARFHFVMELNAHVAGCSLASLLDCHKPESLIKPCQVVL